MAHARQQVRDLVVSTLVTAATAAGSRVYSTRIYPMGTLPTIAVQSSREEIDEDGDTMGAVQMRQLTLIVEGRVKGDESTIDDVADDLAAEIEVALAADTTLGSEVIDIWLESTELEVSGEAEKAIGLISMTYLVQYRVSEQNPSVLV